MPNLYYFHPTCETAVANGSSFYQPNAYVKTFEENLDIIPAFFAQKKDAVLLKNIPSKEFCTYLSSFIDLPEFYLLEELENSAHHFNRFEAWCYSPMLLNKYKSILSLFDSGFLNYIEKLKPNLVKLHSKVSASQLCKTICDHNSSNYLKPGEVAQILSTEDEVLDYIQKEGAKVLKAPLGSSGRGVQVLRRKDFHKSHYEWIKAILKQQKCILGEPLHPKILDLAAQFYITNGRVQYLGMSYFKTNANGLYEGNYLNYKLNDFVPELDWKIIDNWIKELKGGLENSIYTKYYSGYLGCDGLIFKDENNSLRLHPLLEINSRYTMGTMQLALEKVIHPEAKGIYKVYFQKGKDFYPFSEEMSKRYGPQFKNNKPFKGYFPLVEPTKDKIFGAYMLLE